MAVATIPTRNKVRKSFNDRALTWLAVGMFIFLYLPIIILIIYSFNDNRFATVWTGFSTRWYGEVFSRRDGAASISDEYVVGALVNPDQYDIWHIDRHRHGAVSLLGKNHL